MPRILVTPLSAVADAVRRHKPSHLVTLLGPETAASTPDGIVADRHLRLTVHDIDRPTEDMIAPCEDHVAKLLSFADAWDPRDPMLIHCWAGISRSTAAAFIVLCSRNDAGCEAEIARAMRHRAPHAQPNRLLVRHADALLGRKGRMIAAVDAMGMGRETWEGDVFHVPVAFAELWT
jgi:predicted protein tyrosine phosphatase